MKLREMVCVIDNVLIQLIEDADEAKRWNR